VFGIDDLGRRLDAIEAQIAARRGDRWPHGPVYLGDHTALVATRWGAKMLVDTYDSVLTPWLLLDGLWEANVTEWLQRTLRPGFVFVDVGANVGYFTLLGGRLVGPGGQVVAVEAHPRLAELLRRNVVMNGIQGHVTTWQRAAWSEAKTLRFHLRGHYSSSSSVSTAGSDGLEYFYDDEEAVDVESVALDELLSGLPKVDVMKIDVEGAEFHVFTGLERVLGVNPDLVVIFEWLPSQLRAAGSEPGALIDLLAGQGFKFRLIEKDLAPIDRAGLLDLTYGNVVAAR
jgi:FkbM family methyltransferase